MTSRQSPVLDRWRVDLEYAGEGFAGWQLQPSVRTVQGALEDALKTLFGHSIRVTSSGRTDAGVHAEQQPVSFVTAVVRSERGVRRGLNARMHRDVSCLAAYRVPLDFDPRRWPHTKTYRYIWLVRDSGSPLRRSRTVHVRHPLDVSKMQSAVRALEGQHDFSAFRASGCSANHAIRTVKAIAVEQIRDEVHLVVQGSGFLRHMIRIIAGALYEIGQERRSPEWMGEVLISRNRGLAGPTACAHALTLESVRYVPEPERLPFRT